MLVSPRSKVQGPKIYLELRSGTSPYRIGLWTLDFGPWTLDFEPWTLDLLLQQLVLIQKRDHRGIKLLRLLHHQEVSDSFPHVKLEIRH
jgi:hypothetical protein